ncbi:MAG: DinB family protein [Acidobacteriota bacterium]|nr:DinB family protein [Acidobacteriota bacterium]
MSISSLLLPEFEQEMASTRKLLACVPDGQYSWKPHEKSMTLGRLASHVAELPGWAVVTLKQTKLEIAPGAQAFSAQSTAELLDSFDRNVTDARAAIEAAKDEDYDVPWSLVFGGHVAFTMPRYSVMRSVVMNHMIHHRAQLGTYLRTLEIAIPGMYGPSEDDKRAMARPA